MNMGGTEHLSTQQSSSGISDLPVDNHILISPERTHQYELMLHLLAHREQPLVLSGPSGIGKTTILDLLGERGEDSWQTCSIKATAELDFDQILHFLTNSIVSDNPELNGITVTEIMERFRVSGKILLLSIDEAGTLAPGMLTEICRYAEQHPALKVVFALTPNQVHVINNTDPEINNCFFIEFPPLTEAQCGIFLQNLSGRRGATIKSKAINPDLIAAVYKETHGIPGKITEAFPERPRFSVRESETAVSSMFFGAIMIAAVVVFVWWNGIPDMEDKNTEKIIVAEKKQIPSAPSPDFQSHKADSSFETQHIKNLQSVEVKKPEPDNTADVDETTQIEKDRTENTATGSMVENDQNYVSGNNPKVLTPASEDSRNVSSGTDSFAGIVDNRQWVLKQPPENFTLQLMVISNPQSMMKVLRKYQKQKQNIKFFRVTEQGREKYFVIYGSFLTRQDAGRAVQTLPESLQQSWVRRFSGLQKKIESDNLYR